MGQLGSMPTLKRKRQEDDPSFGGCAHDGEIFEDFSSNDRVCTKCGLVVGPAFGVFLRGSNGCESRWACYRPKQRGKGLVFKPCVYNPVFYNAERLRAWFAADPRVPDGFLGEVASELAQQTGSASIEHASRSRIRATCGRIALRTVSAQPTLDFKERRRLLGRLRNYAERWYQIKCRLVGHVPAVDPTLMANCKLLFHIYSTHAMSVRSRGLDSWGPRKVLLTYPYVTVQILRILDYWEAQEGKRTDYYLKHSWYWPRLKTASKLRANDERWVLVVEDINLVRRNYRKDCPNMGNRPWPLFLMAPLQLEMEEMEM